MFNLQCKLVIFCSYTPMKASRIIAACVVLHNWAIAFRTPLLVDDRLDDGDDAGCTGTNLGTYRT